MATLTASPEVGKAIEALLKTFPLKILADTLVAAKSAGAEAAKGVPVVGGAFYLVLRTSPTLTAMAVMKEMTSKAAEETAKRVQEAMPKV